MNPHPYGHYVFNLLSHNGNSRKELSKQNLTDDISALGPGFAWGRPGAEAAGISCLLCGRVPLGHRPQPSKLHLHIQSQGTHLCPSHRKQRWGGPCSAEGSGASSPPSACCRDPLPPFPSQTELGCVGLPLRRVPRLQNNRPSILPGPWQTCLLLLHLCPPLLPGSCPHPRGPEEQAQGLACPLTPASPTKTESQCHSFHLAPGIFTNSPH